MFDKLFENYFDKIIIKNFLKTLLKGAYIIACIICIPLCVYFLFLVPVEILVTALIKLAQTLFIGLIAMIGFTLTVLICVNYLQMYLDTPFNERQMAEIRADIEKLKVK